MSESEEVLFSQEFTIIGGDFSKAGSVSTEIKSVLKQIGFDPAIIRRVAISTYEA
ncbi:MAG: serine/threonine protein kinase, partial [candidate division NC10 bacterium]|nr:serine/threonine protein kinase [candidate division NC10 bacterium]